MPGVVTAWLGAVASVVVGGIGTRLAAALALRAFPKLARVDRLDSIRPPQSPANATAAAWPPYGD